jgi:hypothetical protein
VVVVKKAKTKKFKIERVNVMENEERVKILNKRLDMIGEISDSGSFLRRYGVCSIAALFVAVVISAFAFGWWAPVWFKSKLRFVFELWASISICLVILGIGIAVVFGPWKFLLELKLDRLCDKNPELKRDFDH